MVDGYRPWMRRLETNQMWQRRLGAGQLHIGEGVLPRARRGRSCRASAGAGRGLLPVGRKTVSNSSPLAECSVMIETASRFSVLLGVHDQRDVLEEPSHGPPKLSIERMSSFRLSRRAGASAVLPAFHMSV